MAAKLLLLAFAAAAKAGLIGKYYDTIDWTGKYHYRVDEGVNFNWGLGGPRIRTDRFSVVWEGTINNAGVNTIIVEADDGVELWIDNKLVLSSLEDPYDPYPKYWQGAMQGKSIKLKYFENYGLARAKLRYSSKALTQADWDLWDKTRDITVYPVIPGSWFTAAAKPTGPDAIEVVEITANNIASAKWFTYALIKETTEVRPEYFADGVAPYAYDYSTEFIRKCGDFDLLGITETDNARLTGDRVILKVTMGSVVDYFRPVPGVNLCDMLRTNNLHEWAPDENGPWYKPERLQYNRWSLGGSADWMPNALSFTDFRAYPAFWGGGEGGGCCYLDGDNDSWKKYTWERGGRSWKRAFKMEIKSTLRPEWAPQDLKVKDTDGTWDVLAQIADGTSLKDKTVYQKGWNTDLVSKHAQFIRNCSAYDAWGHEIVMKMRLGRYTRPTTTFHDPDPNSAWSGDLIAYYRPIKGKTLCDMLLSHKFHEWSDTGAVLDFQQPEYHTDEKMAGGSLWGWPRRDFVTGRPKEFNLAHLPFWAGDTAAFGVYFKGQGDGSWGKSFQLLVQKQLRPDINEGDLSTTQGYLTNFLKLGAADNSITVTGVQRPLFKDVLGLCGGKNWHYWGKSCYTVVETDVTYDDAVAGCKTIGGSLVSIHDAGENKFLVGLAYTPVWIDGSDTAKEGTWVHTDGTPFDFTDWAAGEPNGGTNENCASLVNWGDKFWQDRHCTWSKLKYICKKSSNQIPQLTPKAGQSVTPAIGTPTTGTALVWTKVSNNRPPYVWSGNAADSFIDYYAVAIYSPSIQEVTLTTRHDDGMSITVEDKSVYMAFGPVWEDKTAKFTLPVGWSQLVLKFHEDTGNNYWWLKLAGTGLRWRFEK